MGIAPVTWHSVWTGAGRYRLAYLLVILLAVALSPAELALAGRPLWPWYPLLAVPGVLAFYSGFSPDSAGSAPGLWLAFGVGLVPVLLGLATRLPFAKPLRPLHPLWIGLPIGFVGTVGVYYAAAASI